MSSPSKTDAKTASTGSSSSPRRSSNSGMFSNLAGYKRDANPNFQARRASVTDQSTQKPGVIGGLFDKFVRGEHPAGK